MAAAGTIPPRDPLSCWTCGSKRAAQTKRRAAKLPRRDKERPDVGKLRSACSAASLIPVCYGIRYGIRFLHGTSDSRIRAGVCGRLRTIGDFPLHSLHSSLSVAAVPGGKARFCGASLALALLPLRGGLFAGESVLAEPPDSIPVHTYGRTLA